MYLERKVTRRELALFCRQLAVMTGSGIPLLAALKVLRNQAGKGKLKNALDGIIVKLEAGYGFAHSLGAYPEVFSGFVVTMVNAAETGGLLEDILERAADFLEWEHRIIEKVKSSILYPLVVLAFALLAIVFVTTWLLPAFTGILNQMNVEVPLVTRIILGIAGFWGSYWAIIFLLAMAAVAGLWHAIRKKTGWRRAFDNFILGIPLMGGMVRKMIISRFCRTLAALLSVGVPLVTALEVVEKTSGNLVVEEGIAWAREFVLAGEGMTAPLRRCGVFPPLVIEIITVGEETGSLDSMLERIGEFYDSDVENLALRLTALIEPALVVFVGGIVCLVLLSVFLPLFKIIGQVG